MKYFAKILRKCCVVGLFVFLFGCVSMERKVSDHCNEWISRPLSELKQAMKNPDAYASKTNWDETSYPLAKGYFVFVEPFNEDCLIHWKINPRDIIIGYFTEGKGCGSEHGPAPEVREIENVSPPGQ
ncbi:MAG TPA: hypothetical protein VMB78_00520 [Dissulfurispiraceae bacterium]|nr:hypothetical protein [Dissulfurispiraceae bacterium]